MRRPARLAILLAAALPGVACGGSPPRQPRDGAAGRVAAVPTYPFADDPERAQRELFEHLVREVKPETLSPVVAGPAAFTPAAASLRERLRRTLGLDEAGTPAPPPCTGVGRRVGEHHVVERDIVETAPGVPVPVNLYLPTHPRGRVPLILHPHGHSDPGKSADAVQRDCQAFADLGAACLAWDDWGFGERQATGHVRAFELPAASIPLMGLRVRDAMRLIDWASKRPDIDPARIGMTGVSGGGTLTAYVAALDPRVQASAPACALTTYAGGLVADQCPCNYVLGQFAWLSLAGVFALSAPHPQMALAGTRDPYLPLAATRQAAALITRADDAAGTPGRFVLREVDAAHELTPSMRANVRGFLLHALGLARDDAPIAEDGLDVAPASAAELECFPGGTLPRGARTLAHLAAERQRAGSAGRSPIPLRARAGPEVADLAAHLRTVLAPPPSPAPSALPAPGDWVNAGPGLRAARLRLTSDGDLHLAGFVLEPASSPATGTWLLIASEGSHALAVGGLPAELAARGFRVVVGDLRGEGENHATRLDLALYLQGLALGRPLLGGRLADAAGWHATALAFAGGATSSLTVAGFGEGAALALLLPAVGCTAARTVLVDAPVRLAPTPYGDETWGLPLSLSVPGLSSVGEPGDWSLVASETATWIRPRARDGRPLACASHEAAAIPSDDRCLDAPVGQAVQQEVDALLATPPR